jgi:hypothetical protein
MIDYHVGFMILTLFSPHDGCFIFHPLISGYLSWHMFSSFSPLNPAFALRWEIKFDPESDAVDRWIGGCKYIQYQVYMHDEHTPHTQYMHFFG